MKLNKKIKIDKPAWEKYCKSEAIALAKYNKVKNAALVEYWEIIDALAEN